MGALRPPWLDYLVHQRLWPGQELGLIDPQGLLSRPLRDILRVSAPDPPGWGVQPTRRPPRADRPYYRRPLVAYNFSHGHRSRSARGPTDTTRRHTAAEGSKITHTHTHRGGTPLSGPVILLSTLPPPSLSHGTASERHRIRDPSSPCQEMDTVCIMRLGGGALKPH